MTDTLTETSRLRADLTKASTEGLPLQLVAALQEAKTKGYTFADVIVYLGLNGYEIHVLPVGSPEDETEDAAGLDPEVSPDDGEVEKDSAVAGDPAPGTGPTTGAVHVDGVDWGKKKRSYLKKEDMRRFTLAPWYVPGTEDAHGEWTDADTLQQALWGYVRAGDRTIKLQHNTEVDAGEWVEAVTWPQPVDLQMVTADGEIRMESFPANTVFLGVVWEPWAWELVQSGQITGYSIGGKAVKVTGDGPAVPEQVETSADVTSGREG